MVYPNISPLPPAPNPDNPSSFDTLAYPFVAALATLQSQINALADEMNARDWPNTPVRSLINGTAAAPAFGWDADPDTGILRPAANQIGLSTGGVLRALLSNTALQLDVPLTGSAIQSSASDVATPGKAVRVDGATRS